MAIFSERDKVGDIVARLPKAGDVFKAYGIDFCCGGNRSLLETAGDQGNDVQDILRRLNSLYEETSAERQQETDWVKAPLSQLVDHIVNVHHAYLHTTLPILGELVTKILRVHGPHHEELATVHRLFHTLKMEFEQHLIKEESLVFPNIVEFERTGSMTALERAMRAVDELESEHDHSGNLLKEIRQATHGYSVPEDGCGTYHYTFQKLEEVESKTFLHVHLENNILFPRLRSACDTLIARP